MILRIRSPFYIFFLNPVYVAARSLRSLRSNEIVYVRWGLELVRKYRSRSLTWWKKFPCTFHWVSSELFETDPVNRQKQALLHVESIQYGHPKVIYKFN